MITPDFFRIVVERDEDDTESMRSIHAEHVSLRVQSAQPVINPQSVTEDQWRAVVAPRAVDMQGIFARLAIVLAREIRDPSSNHECLGEWCSISFFDSITYINEFARSSLIEHDGNGEMPCMWITIPQGSEKKWKKRAEQLIANMEHQAQSTADVWATMLRASS